MEPRQRDILAILGTWLVVDGIGALLYVYPFLLWQSLRLIRVLIGVTIIVIALFSERRPS